MFTDKQLKKKDIETLKQWLRYKLRGYVVAIKPMVPTRPFFRGVRCGDRPTNIRRISFSPEEKVIRYGRLNRCHQSRFYACTGEPVVFYELHAQQGDCIAVSEWELLEPLWMSNIGFHPQALRRLGAQEQHILRRYPVTHAIPDQTRRNDKLSEQISKTFTEDVREGHEYKYKQSIAIIESMSELDLPFPEPAPDLPRMKKVAGAVYPTIRMRAAADNIALLPEFVESSLRLMSVRYVRVESADETQSAFKLLSIAVATTFPNGEIEWRENTGPEIDRTKYISLQDGHWELRDGYLRLYERH
jgi:hypothetical protein